MNRSVEQPQQPQRQAQEEATEGLPLLFPVMGSSGSGVDNSGVESRTAIIGLGQTNYGGTLTILQNPTTTARRTTTVRTTTTKGHVRAATMEDFSRGTIHQEYGRHPQHSKSLSISGMVSIPNGGFSSNAEWGRQELFIQTPFTAVFGLQGKQRELERAFAAFAANNMVALEKEQRHLQWDEMEMKRHVRNASAMILQDLEYVDAPQTVLTTTPFIWAILVATASQFSVGYNTGVMNAPEKVVFVGHSTTLWSWAVAAFAVGGPLGAVLGGRLADSQGRRGAFLIDVAAFLLGGTLQTLAPSMTVIVLSRFIIGFASGFSSVLVPIYLGELAPPRLRGALGTLTQFAMVIGILVADLLAFPFATESGWRCLFAVTPIIALLQVMASPFLLESPRWLLQNDPKSIQARSIIKQLRGISEEHELENELSNYTVAEAAQHHDEKMSQWAISKQMFQNKRMRLLLISSLILHTAQQLGGINAVFYYSTSFFEGVIDNPLLGTTLVGAVNVVATYAALLLMDSCGRRSLILWSAGGMFVSCLIIVSSLLGYVSKILALVAVVSYVCFFEIGLGPVPWLIVAEMFEGRYVTVAMSLCSQLNWSCNFIIGLVFPWMNENLGAYSFGPFALILASCFVYAWFVLPETHGTTPEELMTEMAHRSSSRSMQPSFSSSSSVPPTQSTLQEGTDEMVSLMA